MSKEIKKRISELILLKVPINNLLAKELANDIFELIDGHNSVSHVHPVQSDKCHQLCSFIKDKYPSVYIHFSRMPRYKVNGNLILTWEEAIKLLEKFNSATIKDVLSDMENRPEYMKKKKYNWCYKTLYNWCTNRVKTQIYIDSIPKQGY